MPHPGLPISVRFQRSRCEAAPDPDIDENLQDDAPMDGVGFASDNQGCPTPTPWPTRLDLTETPPATQHIPAPEESPLFPLPHSGSSAISFDQKPPGSTGPTRLQKHPQAQFCFALVRCHSKWGVALGGYISRRDTSTQFCIRAGRTAPFHDASSQQKSPGVARASSFPLPMGRG